MRHPASAQTKTPGIEPGVSDLVLAGQAYFTGAGFGAVATAAS